MILPELMKGKFLRRINRFRVEVSLDGRRVDCYLPNPARLSELLITGAKSLISARERIGKTRYDLIGIFDRDQLVSIDSRIPNLLFEEAIREGRLEDFRGLSISKREYRYGRSRFDFFLTDGEDWLVEVKSCSLVVDGVALFPDVPTKRGTRQLLQLIEARKKCYRAAVVWVVQRSDALLLTPNDKVDPEFASALRRAVGEGVFAIVYYGQLRGRRMRIEGKLPLRLEA